jgi:hypothetical protein
MQGLTCLHAKLAKSKGGVGNTRVDHNHMQMVVAVDDPKIYTKPFILSKNEYRWIPDQEAEEQMCVPSEMINYMNLISKPASGVNK